MIIQKKAYAKINLYLKILDKLPNGYHGIFTVMQKISLCDDINININPCAGQNINIICSDKNIPSDKTNTVYKASKLFFDSLIESGISLPDIEIDIEIAKKIPSLAGLGGGSSDAAVVLLGLNEYYDFILSESDLINIAAKVGADVPFFVKNVNCAICEGIGETVTPVDMDLSGFVCLTVKPAYNISTKKAFEDWDKYFYTGGQISPPRKFDDIIKNIHSDFAMLIFEQNINIREIKDFMMANGAAAAGLSGSGSALFGIFDDFSKARECKSAVIKRNGIEFCDIFDFLY